MDFSLNYTLENELENAQKIFNNMEWFKKHNYNILLPTGIGTASTIDELKTAVSGDYEKRVLDVEILKSEVEKELVKYKESIDIFFSGFHYVVPKKINVNFTEYGPGGMYILPDSVVVIIKDSPRQVVQMILHEVIHLVIEIPFVKKYNLSHWEKEAAVDTLCLNERLGEIFSGYSRQPQTRGVKLDFFNILDYKKTLGN